MNTKGAFIALLATFASHTCAVEGKLRGTNGMVANESAGMKASTENRELAGHVMPTEGTSSPTASPTPVSPEEGCNETSPGNRELAGHVMPVRCDESSPDDRKLAGHVMPTETNETSPEDRELAGHVMPTESNDTSPALPSESSLCSFDGETAEPGQWLDGPTMMCMCDRFGSGAFVNCITHSEPEPAANNEAGSTEATAFGRRQKFQAEDFAFDLLGSVPAAMNEGGSVQVAFVNQVPVLENSGLAYAMVNLEPCGINLPHAHPRASELIYVIEGEMGELRTAFVEENGGRVIVNDM